jgi:hypothetical protein
LGRANYFSSALKRQIAQLDNGWNIMIVKHKPWIAIIYLLLTLSLAACGTGLILTPSEQPLGGDDNLPTSGDLDIIITPPSGQPPAEQPPAGEDIIVNVLPDEYHIYQGYLDVINARPGMADFGEIEGTIVSITHSEICPYPEEDCPIEPYPNDWGIVRVDRVLTYASFSGVAIEPIIEQSAEGDNEGVTSTSGSGGQDIGPKEITAAALSEGQEVTSQFVLTARPVILRFVPGEETVPFDAPNNLEGNEGDTIEQPAQPREIVYQPLPQSDDVYIFTTQFGEVKEEVQKKLSGLEVGTRFRAEIRYDGILYIYEYEIIPE